VGQIESWVDRQSPTENVMQERDQMQTQTQIIIANLIGILRGNSSLITLLGTWDVQKRKLKLKKKN
jgi:hypothetical protein